MADTDKLIIIVKCIIIIHIMANIKIKYYYHQHDFSLLDLQKIWEMSMRKYIMSAIYRLMWN